MGHKAAVERSKRAGNGERVGRQEVQHTHRSEEHLLFLTAYWHMSNSSDVVREALDLAARRMGWRPKP
jgi:hypothetical protein